MIFFFLAITGAIQLPVRHVRLEPSMRTLIQKRIYNVENPFDDWMQAISLNVKTDFFVNRVYAYGKSSVSAKKEDLKIRFDDMSF